ncbi:MAG: type II toxin-antitoxin system VapC family toxin [Candidatus Bathyarchaeota archaeon]|nr:type II toxin-antitoxin system VapC family toxin [Candidatus Bathyarchaeota archaeon]
MSLLFDSSAIINLSHEGKTELYIDHVTTPLAQYEIGNAVWKMVNLTHEMTEDAGKQYLTKTLETLRFMTEIIVDDAETVLEIASRERLSYYDASYIHAAVTTASILVTDDTKLRKVAARYVTATGSANIDKR